mmetsp:Transcript_20224/g.40318  ORF Transcript_20224/g.40318 Transcript_20224/m.40318 type:complete len:204 (-) Transcript_20224:687-1298(-)
MLGEMPRQRHGRSSEFGVRIGHRTLAHEDEPRNTPRIKDKLRDLMEDVCGCLPYAALRVMERASDDPPELQLVRKIQMAPENWPQAARCDPTCNALAPRQPMHHPQKSVAAVPLGIGIGIRIPHLVQHQQLQQVPRVSQVVGVHVPVHQVRVRVHIEQRAQQVHEFVVQQPGRRRVPVREIRLRPLQDVPHLHHGVVRVEGWR